MILIDNALAKLEEQGAPIRVGMVGAGTLGTRVANQIINSMPGMRLVAIANRTVSKAIGAYKKAGVEDIVEASSLTSLDEGVSAGKPVVTDDAAILCESLGVDVILDATGTIEFGANVAIKAFEYKKDVVSVSAELIAPLGLILQEKARQAGVMYSIADGDQPGIEINLWRYVKGIGLNPLVCGNIKGLQDEYRTPATQKAFAEQWGQDPRMVTSFADGSKMAIEQACVANATEMQVEMRGMRGGDFEGHVDDLCQSGRYDIDKIRSLGGVVDYTIKTLPAPGVFVLATHDDPLQREALKFYKLGDGPLYCLYTPYHLCHFDVPMSTARLVLFRDYVLETRRQMVDVITVAKKNLKTGEILDGIGGFAAYGVAENHSVAKAENLLPHGLSEGCRLKCDISKDTAISFGDVEVPEGRLCDRLFDEQNALEAVT
jgi:predicted homoserine dehydrogenase-like protein